MLQTFSDFHLRSENEERLEYSGSKEQNLEKPPAFAGGLVCFQHWNNRAEGLNVQCPEDNVQSSKNYLEGWRDSTESEVCLACG